MVKTKILLLKPCITQKQYFTIAMGYSWFANTGSYQGIQIIHETTDETRTVDAEKLCIYFWLGWFANNVSNSYDSPT